MPVSSTVDPTPQAVIGASDAGNSIATACRAMINILLDQKFNEIIPAHLPGTVKVAHKTGSITGIQHDSGIVFLPDGKKYVLVLLSQFQPADEKKVIQAMANVSKHFYNHMLEK